MQKSRVCSWWPRKRGGRGRQILPASAPLLTAVFVDDVAYFPSPSILPSPLSLSRRSACFDALGRLGFAGALERSAVELSLRPRFTARVGSLQVSARGAPGVQCGRGRLVRSLAVAPKKAPFLRSPFLPSLSVGGAEEDAKAEGGREGGKRRATRRWRNDTKMGRGGVDV